LHAETEEEYMFDKKQICLNGQFISGEKQKFFSENRAFLYGDSVFETMFVCKGKIHFFNEHLYRLLRAMNVLNYTVPSVFTVFKDRLEEEIFSLIAKNKIYKSAAVRLTVFRNPGGLYTPETNEVSYVIYVREIKNDRYELNASGLFTDLYEEIKKPINILAPFKTGNSLIYTLGGIYKTEQNLDDCLISNEKGHIIEALSSNMFLVKNDRIITPPVADGCVDGIMRKQIIHLCKQHDIECLEHSVTPEMMNLADELFLTNSINGIRWVVAYKEKRYFKKYSNFFLHKLNEMHR
jgi:branched-subunit amino acid aminotransferase/4-amino-4-deoxychorismate lyase